MAVDSDAWRKINLTLKTAQVLAPSDLYGLGLLVNATFNPKDPKKFPRSSEHDRVILRSPDTPNAMGDMHVPLVIKKRL